MQRSSENTVSKNGNCFQTTFFTLCRLANRMNAPDIVD
ncbi:hypothetical protein MCC93_25360 [Morococcus cerebrosus]|uniref:Uncharacterized protein n=1 Tax=Morococcus cerebrosus TaxID=1056807 RepID=A0A0C1EB04_9NEIS|nr:hypothetical protein MCC93_25360 [Morococcus cerebrosus]